MPKFDKDTPGLVAAANRHGIDWQKSLSPNDYLIAEVLSAVIKEIRRGNEEASLYWALEMAACGRTAEEFLWECLLVCVPEDIGLANAEALAVVTGAKNGYFSLPEKDRRRRVFLAFAVSYMARSKKSRYVSELLGDVRDRMSSREMNLAMPEYALDIHTDRGKQMGRGKLHYLTEASALGNKDMSLPDTYLQRSIDRARKEK